MVANPNPNIKRRDHSRAVGIVVKAKDQHKWEVLFDYNNKRKVCNSKLLTIVLFKTGVPLHKEQQHVSNSNLFIYLNIQSNLLSFLLQIKAILDDNIQESNLIDSIEESEETTILSNIIGDKYKSNAEDIGLKNANFTFTEDYFKAASQSRHHSSWMNAWRKINELEGHEKEYKNVVDGKIA